MIAFGSAVNDRETYATVALPGIRKVAEPDSVVLTRHGYDSIQRPYNELLDEALGHDDLEAVVLLHQDLELLDDSLLRRVRPLLAEPDVGVVGVYGARSLPLRAWRTPEDLFGRATTRLIDVHHSAGAHEVEFVDGALLVVAPWAARAARFDERLAQDFHGYDVDFCQRVRAVGGRVICVDVPYRHHMERIWTDSDAVRRANWAIAQRWDPALRPPEWAASFAQQAP